MIIHNVTQNSPEWIALRLGKVTASEMDALVSPEGKVRTGAGPQSYLYQKLAEKILGFSLNDASTFAMNQGSIVEMEALPWFAFAHDVKIDRVGFCTSDDLKIGFSPDGLIGEDGGIEVKSPQPARHLEYLMEGGVPKEYRVQIQFSLYVSGRKWWKFMSYSRQFPALVVHVEPEDHMQTAIKHALFGFPPLLGGFLPLFDEKLAEITALRDAENALKSAAYEASLAKS